MKRLAFYLYCGVICMACSSVSDYRNQMEAVEAVIEDNPDSAWIMLRDIPSSLLSDGEEKALYNLLMTEAAYKLYKPFKDDSLINYSITFYKQHNNQPRLATAYYYKGSINYDELGNKEQGVLFYKEAEELANKGNDELLKAKLYESLRNMNAQIGDQQLAMHYSRLFLASSKRLGNPMYIANAYENMASDYGRVGNTEAENNYRDSSLYYVSMCDDRDKARIYANYANTLIKNKRYTEAKQYLMKAVELRPEANRYVMLGKIAKQEGDTIEARRNWEKAITFNEPRFSITAYKHLANLYIERGDYLQALWMGTKADSINIVYQEQKRTSELAEVQRRYDKAVVEKELIERKNFWLTLAVTAMPVLMIALLAIFYFIRKNREYKGIIDQNIEHIFQYKQRIDFLTSMGAEFEEETKSLQEQMVKLKQATAMRLGSGKIIYEAVVNGNKLHEFTKEKEQDFIDYYAFTYSKEFHEMIKPYRSLTLRHTTYLILEQMHFSDKQIGEILNVTDSTVRNYRHRLNRK